MYKHGLLLSLVLLAGCHLVNGTERDLIGYSQKGVTLLRQGIEEKSKVIAQYHHLQRMQLDNAFDADVRNHREKLDAQWVIDARIAYASGIDLLSKEQQQSMQATTSQLQTADALHSALQKLQMLQDVQTHWDIPAFEAPKGDLR